MHKNRQKELEELINQRLTYREIGKIMGVTRQRVQQLCQRYGLRTKHLLTPADIDARRTQIINYSIVTGKSLTDASKELNIPKTGVTWTPENRELYVLEKFMKRLDTSTEHWTYNGCQVNGYSRGRLFGETQGVHRLLFELIHNRRPQRLRKVCDVKGCVRHFEEF